mmetsp:Transcript_37329/g.83055  ORF Transcript_37329/g.83055 Transcript_37329/m.83055 type:complete len:323 (+) Transcript_37329:409-1377(+)|eukprot:CAMPEP_0202901134 /NCGR_PEP_ID=MMETSP1392-20130828/13467_1 /ASSEMBLY_ACC=CAM_ASM_000868 /TAXON_ID=225041 /ORGANISM="Chlamydomonas chlamydogama, Strain SAG 11-48b" /LENGTH=322 /DNA_ID=CAMNT_0049587643 /DNA_START=409 /DNA_END=1377 /DNA_ORIENTATION=+
MKFCKVLESQAKDIPELNHMFLRYKQLKKQIKAIPQHNREGNTSGDATNGGQLSAEEHEFLATLNEDLNRFNSFFIDQEESAVIKLQALTDELQRATTAEQLQEHKARLVHFHGEMVLMLHWSLINYSAIVKILKKHDKRTGVLLRAPYLANVLHQPFYSTSVLSRLVKKAEELVQQTGEAPRAGSTAEAMPSSTPHHGHEDETSDEDASSLTAAAEEGTQEAVMAKRAKIALETWASLARTASTPSTVLATGMSAGASAAPSCSGAQPDATVISMSTAGALASGKRRRGTSSGDSTSEDEREVAAHRAAQVRTARSSGLSA